MWCVNICKNQHFGLRMKLELHYSCQKMWLWTVYGGIVFQTFISGQFNVGLEVIPVGCFCLPFPPASFQAFVLCPNIHIQMIAYLSSYSLLSFPLEFILNSFFCHVFFWWILTQGHIDNTARWSPYFSFTCPDLNLASSNLHLHSKHLLH